jgi:formylglycine-generating enzyme required for sulfatase activity
VEKFLADIKAAAASSAPDPRLKAVVRLEHQVLIPGGTILVGGLDKPSTSGSSKRSSRGSVTAAGSWSDQEIKTRVAEVKPFKIDRHTVTNADFMAFSRHKPNYRTEAEKRGYSWVLTKNVNPDVPIYDDRTVQHEDGTFWTAVRNATWFQPHGDGSSLTGQLRSPVVHIGYRDAFAFCSWANKRLPTEEEWEMAARAGVNNTRYPWGNHFAVKKSNLWQGTFPGKNLATDGFEGLSPVDIFPMQNSYGLFDMLGNVWEWTSTIYTVPLKPRDRNKPRFTLKGGSFIDTEVSVSNAARMGRLPEYTAENVGLRCVESVDIVDGQSGASGGRRTPVRHRLSDTWSYKVKKALKAMFGGTRTRQNEEL